MATAAKQNPTVAIVTTQNVAIDYELATLGERFIAQFLDYLIFVAFFIVLILIFIEFGLWGSWATTMILYTTPFWFTIFYFAICEALMDGQTFGKRGQKIKVVRLDGKPLTWGDLFLRSVLRLVDFTLSSGIIGAAFIMTSAYRQRLGDMAAFTTVIRIGGNRKFSIREITQTPTNTNYQVQFPQVRDLPESDVLQIQQILQRCQKNKNYEHQVLLSDLVSHLVKILNIQGIPKDQIAFLKTIIADYVVLTR